ncbi:MAG: phage tail protein [Hafnia alvei]|uniref:phage tail-collar fiber domain-containing protein n=1 Tax=Hafnia alvei TaxID=569 RepID=UPI00290B9F50|nr:phage tail protein [Hafnia alvei]MDU7483885.1 phage tail protein [Hafnia alvei]
MANFYSIITNRGKELEAEALASGTKITLVKFVVGDGNGQATPPKPTQTKLVNEKYRGDIGDLSVSPDQSTQMMAKIVLPIDVGGFTVREIGILTDAGELYAVANCAAIEKPVGGVSVNMQFRLAVSDTANITLNVATGDGLFLRIDQNLSEIRGRGAQAQKTARESLAVVDASTKQKGLVQLNSATNSTSETQAATPAAVKAANDNANGRVPSGRKVNGKALSADINVTSTDIFDVQAVGIGANQNLNNFKTPGIYYQTANANSSLALNYPEAQAGTLLVYKNAGITQEYRVYNSSRIYTRSQYMDGAWTPWAKQYNSLNKPNASDVDALPISGGTLNGNLIVKNQIQVGGVGNGVLNIGDNDSGLRSSVDGQVDFWANSKKMGYWNINILSFTGQIIPTNYANFDAKYQSKGDYTPAGQAYTKAESDNRFQPKGNYTPAGEAYTKAVSDGRFQPKGNYTPAGEAYTKAVSDGRFQPKGSYTPAGQAYTKGESDGRYIQNMRLGTAATISIGGNGSVPGGCVVVGAGTDDWKFNRLIYKPIQRNINGVWATISG